MKKAYSLLMFGNIAAASLAGPAFAVDAMLAPAARQVDRVEAASCLRWVWQQYSWYDDCWAARYPYMGRAARFAAPRR